MSITRLSGGLTPADGSDPRTFPTIFNNAADTVEAQGTAITGLQSDVDALEADSIPTDVTSPNAGEKLVFDGTNWVNLEGYVFVETVYFTSNGTFSKGDYSWLRAIRVKCAGGGGGSGKADADNRISGGGGGGGYGELFLTNIAGLSASESINVGAGGDGGVTGSENGEAGGASEALGVVANGGEGGQAGSGSFGEAQGGTVSGADFDIKGGAGGTRRAGVGTDVFNTASPGGSPLGNHPPTRVGATSQAGADGTGYGVGGAGCMRFDGGSEPSGLSGRPGIVILELFA